jgi:Na+/H+-dicarboxylate symporter
MSRPEPEVTACLDRTRATVLNVLIVVGVGIALSGFALRDRNRGVLLGSPLPVQRGAHMALIGLIVASFALRRVVAGRSALRDPARRSKRLYWAHVLSAIVGALAVPLGFAYGWAIRPRIDAVAPFWVAALALGLLALPRAHELEGFDKPMTPRKEPCS